MSAASLTLGTPGHDGICDVFHVFVEVGSWICCVQASEKALAWMVVFMPGDTTSIAFGWKGRLSKNFVVVAPAQCSFQAFSQF